MKENIKLPLFYGASIETFRRAEILRNHMTKAEQMLWDRLNHKQLKGFRFRRQHPVNRFIVDFYGHKAKLVIELDGEIHQKFEVMERDEGREDILKNYGLTILRFHNSEVEKNIDMILSKIGQVLTNANSKPL